MKRCPECRRDYYDDSLSYCLEDGAVLLLGLPDEPPTAILSGDPQTSEPSTRSFGRSVGLNNSDQTIPPPVPSKRKVVAFTIFVVGLIAAVGTVSYFYLNRSANDRIGSIAVMPFENRSGSPDTDYLSDGLTDSLIFRLSQLPDLKVSPTSSVMHYRGSSDDISQIAKELDVDAVMTGRLSQVGDALNISVQLTDARTKKLIWAEQYDRKMADLLSTQREIATAITQKLQLKLSGNEKGIAKKYTNSNDAYQLYLKGRFYWARRTKDDMFKSIESFKQAIDLDPNFALAYVGIAEAYNSMGKNPDALPAQTIPNAKAAALRALELDSSLPEAHSALGDSLSLYDWDWSRSEAEFKRAIELDPNISYIHTAYAGTYLTATGKMDEAVSESERAVELEPLSLINNSVLTSMYIFAHNYDKARVQAQRTYELDPNFPLSKLWLGISKTLDGKYDDAIGLYRDIAPDSPQRMAALVITGFASAKAGRRDDAENAVKQLNAIADSQYVRPYYLAWIYTALGNKDRAIAELQRSFEQRDCFIPRARVDPLFDALRDDPRFTDLISKMKLPN